MDKMLVMNVMLVVTLQSDKGQGSTIKCVYSAGSTSFVVAMNKDSVETS